MEFSARVIGGRRGSSGQDSLAAGRPDHTNGHHGRRSVTAQRAACAPAENAVRAGGVPCLAPHGQRVALGRASA
jgi:hypothetical protein